MDDNSSIDFSVVEENLKESTAKGNDICRSRNQGTLYPRQLLALSTDDLQAEIKFGSNKYLAMCGVAGIMSCGITHTGVVPLDIVKTRIQVDPAIKNTVHGFKVTIANDGIRGLAIGWAPTAIGYSLQGMHKFGLYEFFKIKYCAILGEEWSYKYRTSVYLAASASAEFFADIALSPMEAAKVRMQTQPGFARTLREALPKMWAQEGFYSFYKGLTPLWFRQIPYTMMKFACFERTVEALYKYVVPKPRDECTKPQQLVVTFIGGYIAGVFCVLVSHPADSVVSKLNQDAGRTMVQAARSLGMSGLWKGFGPRVVMIGTLTALQWFIYDSFKIYFSMPRPPPPEMPASMKAKINSDKI